MTKSHLRGASTSLILTFAILGGAINGRGESLTPKPGAYRIAGRTVYVGIEAEPPAHTTNPMMDSSGKGLAISGRVEGLARQLRMCKKAERANSIGDREFRKSLPKSRFGRQRTCSIACLQSSTGFNHNYGRVIMETMPLTASQRYPSIAMTWSEYHESTKHSIESLKRAPHLLDWRTYPIHSVIMRACRC